MLASVVVSLPASADSLPAPTLTSPAASGTTSTNPVFTWDAVPLASKYRIQVSTSQTFSSVQYTADVFGTSATPTTELPVGTLYWHVASIDSTSTLGVYSDSLSFTRTSPTAPAPTSPADGHAFVYPADSPVLSWSAVPGMVSYRVQVDDAADFVSPITNTTTEGTSLSLSTAIPSNSVRYWRVQGTSTTGSITTDWSSTRSFTVTWPSSAKPTLLTPADDLVTAVDDVTFSWTPVAGAAKYELELSTTSNFTTSTITTTYATRYRPLVTLAADQYYWRVRGIDPSGNSTDWSTVSAFNRVWLGAGGLEARPTVTLTDTDSGTAGVQLELDKLAVSWTPVPRATKYEFEISTDSSFNSTNTAVRRTCITPHTTWTPYLTGDYTETSGFTNCAWAGTPTSAASTKFVVVGGGPYYVRVRAVDMTTEDGPIYSAWSNAATSDESAPAASVFSVVASTTPTTSATDPAHPLSSPDSADTPLLTWQPVSGAVAYLVWVARDSNFTNTVTSTSGAGTYVVTTQTQLVLADVLLDNTVGQPYYWFALPCSSWTSATTFTCSVGSNQAINVAGFYDTFNKRGLAVSGTTSAATQTDTVAFSWADQLTTSPGGGGVTDYQVQVRNSSNVIVDDVLTDATGYTPIALAYPDGPYTWQVRGIDAAGTALDWSASKAFTKTSSAPTSLDDETSSVRLPVLDWEATSFAKSYELELYRGTDPTFPSGNKEGATLTTSYPVATPADALPVGTYSWRVRQIDSNTNPGPWSSGTPDFTVAAATPALSAPADAGSASSTSLRFAWTSVSDATKYKIQSSTTAGFGTLFEDVTTVSNTYAPVKAYVGGTTYYWRVQVLNSDNDVVATSATSSFVAQTTPAAPSATMSADGTTVTVGYTPNSSGGSAVTGYSVRYRVFGTSTWTVLNRASDTASVAIGGLSTSTKYEAQVAATNAIGTGPWSSLVSATTDTTPSAPTNLKVTAGNGQLTVSWSKPADGGSPITGYIVRWGSGQTTVTGTSTTITGLTPGVSYSVDVAAVNVVGTGPYATSVQGTPNSGTTPTPTPTPTTTTKPPAATATTVTIAGGKKVVSGTGAALSGVLKTSAGAAVSGKSVTVQSRPVGATSWTTAATVTTTSTGGWSATVKPTENREFRAVFAAATPYTASSSGTTTVLVAPKITRKLSATTVKKGAKVTFTGTVSPAHKGKTVALQRLQSGTWVTKKSATTSTTSTYKLVWKTDSTKDFRWRVYMAKDAQHVAGASPKILLTVK
jgi:hypothetical protein